MCSSVIDAMSCWLSVSKGVWPGTNIIPAVYKCFLADLLVAGFIQILESHQNSRDLKFAFSRLGELWNHTWVAESRGESWKVME